MAVDAPQTLGFKEFVEVEGVRLRRALIVALGRELGVEGTSEALSYAWEYWDRVRDMENPVGYLYRVGRAKGAFPHALSSRKIVADGSERATRL